jgi:effector-binding domain-containing protein
MAIEVTIKKTDPATVAFISKKGLFSQIPEAFGKLYGWVGQKGYVPSGPPSGVYFNAPGQVPDSELMWELRAPIAGTVAASGPDKDGLGVKKVKGTLMASTMHKGPYEEIAAVYGALASSIAEKGYEMAGPPEEVYFSEPTVLPKDILTEIRFPVKKARKK